MSGSRQALGLTASCSCGGAGGTKRVCVCVWVVLVVVFGLEFSSDIIGCGHLAWLEEGGTAIREVPTWG